MSWAPDRVNLVNPILESNTIQGVPVLEGMHTRQKHAHHWQLFTHAYVEHVGDNTVIYPVEEIA